MHKCISPQKNVAKKIVALVDQQAHSSPIGTIAVGDILPESLNKTFKQNLNIKKKRVCQTKFPR